MSGVVISPSVLRLSNKTQAVFGNTQAVFCSIGDSAYCRALGGRRRVREHVAAHSERTQRGRRSFQHGGSKNGWRAIILSPLYGGIFALLLFVLFAAGVLKGSVFPAIITRRSRRLKLRRVRH